MKFSDIIGQEKAKNRLFQQLEQEHLPHALMLSGQAGVGKLPLALALARRLLCTSPNGNEPCGECQACRMTSEWMHPDLHFAFPVIKKKASGTAPVSDEFLAEWRQQLKETPYFSIGDWLKDMGAENQQAIYYVTEADNILKKLAIKSSQGGKRVVILWLPERMNQETANKLLKLIEEPPTNVHFILVSQEPDQVLGTIQSRTQRIPIDPLSEDEIELALISKHAVPQDLAKNTAHVAQGSYTTALNILKAGAEAQEDFELFVSLMRYSYARKIKDMRQWADKVAGMGRERQKQLLTNCQRLIRENFIYNFHKPGTLNYMTREEEQFASRFARFVNERNVIPIMEELANAQNDIEQNVSAKMVFFDFAIKMIILLKQ